MSPLLRDRLLIGLAPERLTALRVGGRLRPGIQERYDLALQAADGAPWDTLMTALEVLLDQADWRARDLTIILSSNYVHYALIPGGRRLATAEQNDLARLVFRNTFGELSHDWELRVSPSADLPTLASGVPRSFLKALRDVCDGRGRLRSIQPVLMAVFNRTRSLLAQGTGTLAVVEAGRISLAGIRSGQWQSVISRAGASDTLTQFLADENELHGHAAGEMLWLCDLTGEVRLVADSPWRIERLRPPAATGDGVTGLADWGLE